MRIAFVNMPWTSSPFPVRTGDSIGLCTQALVTRLCQTHEVIVYGGRRPNQRKVVNADGVQFRRVFTLPDSRVLNPLVGQFTQLLQSKHSPYSSLWYNFVYGMQVALDLRHQDCDIVHVHGFSQVVSMIRWFNPTIKIALHTHDEWLVQFDYDRMVGRVAQTDLVIGCSEYITHKHRQQFPQYAARCKTVFNGVDPNLFPPVPEKPFSKHLLFIGRVSPEKGVHVLLQAFNQLVEQDPEVQLTLVGSLAPMPSATVKALSKDPKVQALVDLCGDTYIPYLHSLLSPAAARRVRFVGEVEHSQLRSYLQEADVLINPSFSESFGLSIVEAMAIGLPVVAARVGGMMDTVIEGETGFFFESGDVAQLTSAIAALLNDPDRARAMGQQGRQHVLEHFTWNAAVQQLSLHYQALGQRPDLAAPMGSIASVS